MHDVADEFQHRAQFAAGMEIGEFQRGKAAAFEQRDRERVADRGLHQRGRGRRQIMRTGFARLRQLSTICAASPSGEAAFDVTAIIGMQTASNN